MKQVTMVLCLVLMCSIACAKTYSVTVDDKIAEYAERSQPNMEQFLAAQVINEADKVIGMEVLKKEAKKGRMELISELEKDKVK